MDTQHNTRPTMDDHDNYQDQELDPFQSWLLPETLGANLG